LTRIRQRTDALPLANAAKTAVMAELGRNQPGSIAYCKYGIALSLRT
jgi:hypothetical protein